MKEAQNPQRAGRRRLYLTLGVLALAAGSAIVLAHGGRGFQAMHGGGMDFDEISDHFQVRVEHVLRDIEATPDQQAQVKGIVQAAAVDLKALRAEHGNAHRQLHEILMAPTIDRARLEALRVEHLAALDTASKRCTTALADAAAVLTPEQRAELAAKMARRMH